MNNIKKRFTKNLKNIVRISNKLRTFAHETKKPMNTYNFPFSFFILLFVLLFSTRTINARRFIPAPCGDSRKKRALEMECISQKRRIFVVYLKNVINYFIKCYVRERK